MNRHAFHTVAIILATLLGISALAEAPRRMVRLHSEWSWTGEKGAVSRVAKSELTWARDDEDFPKHDLESVILFQDQAGNRWVLESRRRRDPDRFDVSLRLLESGETVTVSMFRRAEKNIYLVQGCGSRFECEEGLAGAPQAQSCRREIASRLSPAFLSALNALRPWIEKGYLGVNASSFLRYAFDFSASDPLSTLSETVLQPLRPAPVDCAFDASFGFPCSPEEAPRDSRGFIYEKTSRSQKP